MMVDVEFETLPQFREDWTEVFKEIVEMISESTEKNRLEGGNPPWVRTQYGGIARIYDFFKGTEQKEYGKDFAEVRIGGRPGSFAHEFGAEFFVDLNAKGHEGMRSHFWKMYYQTGDDKWKGMALSHVLHIKIPARPSMVFSQDLKEYIAAKMLGALVHIVPAKEATFGNA